VSDIYKTVMSRVIHQAIKDLVYSGPQEKSDAIKYVQSDLFLEHCAIARFPRGLQDALDEMMLMSRAEQKVVAKMVIEELASCG
jgi:hypothetical protein